MRTVSKKRSKNAFGLKKSHFHKQNKAKNTGAWKGRLKRFFVDPYPVKLAKNGANII